MRAKIPLSDSRFDAVPEREPLHAAITEAAARAFADEIVQREFFDPFSEPTLYVADRHDIVVDKSMPKADPWAEDEKFQASPLVPADQRPYQYEHELDDYFWNGDKNVIFVLGDPGCGKSTFMHFYLYGQLSHGVVLCFQWLVRRRLGSGECSLCVVPAQRSHVERCASLRAITHGGT
jgi:hypothetical protein